MKNGQLDLFSAPETQPLPSAEVSVAGPELGEAVVGQTTEIRHLVDPEDDALWQAEQQAKRKGRTMSTSSLSSAQQNAHGRRSEAQHERQRSPRQIIEPHN